MLTLIAVKFHHINRAHPGTTLIVEELFCNLPVRAKFLKSVQSDFAHCFELAQSFALAHPHLSINLKHNGRERLCVHSDYKQVKLDGESDWGEAILRDRFAQVSTKK